MALFGRFVATISVATVALATASTADAAFLQINSLVTDDQGFLATQGFGPAAFVDPNLINPWGVSFSPTGPFWVSNQGTGTSTLYDGAGQPIPLIVTTPQGGPPAGPTGQVFNGLGGFNLPNGAPSVFLFANLDGSISGWNPALGTAGTVSALTAVPGGSGAIYTGLAIGSTASGNFLYAANRVTGGIDVFDESFNPVSIAGSFVDPGPNPAGLVPFNVQNIGGLIYVTYSIPGPDADDAGLGLGFVSVFNPDGTFVRRAAENANMVSPWGVVVAPSEFGDFDGALLVGNFSDEFGFINAFDPTTGAFLGQLSGQGGTPLNIPYLWALFFGNGGVGGDPFDLYFTAGIGDELHGLLGEIEVVPLPAAFLMFGAGLGGLALLRRRRREI